jgi:hypothetical protein
MAAPIFQGMHLGFHDTDIGGQEEIVHLGRLSNGQKYRITER